MKKLFDIREFEGLLNNIDKKDIPVNNASESNNVDPTGLGELKGMPLASTLQSSSGVGFKLGSWIERDDNKKDLIFGTATDIHALTDFYGTLGLSASLATSSASTMVSDAKSVHIGTTDTPKWAGYVGSPQFNGGVEFDGTGFDGLVLNPNTLPNETANYEVQINALTTPVYITPTSATYTFATHTATFITGAAHGLSDGDKVRVKLYWIKLYFPSTPPYLPMEWEDWDLHGTVTGELTVTAVDATTFTVVIDFEDYLGGAITEGTGFWQYSDADFTGTPADTVYTKTLSELTYIHRKTVGGSSSVWVYKDVSFDVYDKIEDDIEIKFIESADYDLGDEWTISVSAKTDTLTLAEAEPLAVDCVSINAIQGDTGTAFNNAKTYFYGYSLTYDFVQESELITNKVAYTPTADSDYLLIGLKVNSSTLPTRVTSINIYRAEASTINVTEPDTLYTLVESISLNGWREYKYSLYDYGSIGATYEANSGFPQNITDITPSYQVSCELNSSLFIGNCEHPKLDDASHTIFKSKPFRFDSFDWINEGLKINFVPKAMFGYAGRLWVFDANRFLKVNPELYIEDTIEGIGCTNHLCWVVTDYGAFWSDAIGAYANVDGSTSKLSEGIVWTARDRVIFDAQYNMVMFYLGNDVLAYSPLRKRWENYTDLVSGTVTGAFTGINGETYTAHTVLSKNFGGTRKRALTWVSKEFDFDNPSQFKYFYRVICDYTNGGGSTTTVTYSIDSGTNWKSLTSPDLTRTAGAWDKAKTIMVKIVTTAGTTGDALIRNLSIVYRELVNK